MLHYDDQQKRCGLCMCMSVLYESVQKSPLHPLAMALASWAGFSLSSGVAVIGSQPYGRAEGLGYLVSEPGCVAILV